MDDEMSSVSIISSEEEPWSDMGLMGVSLLTGRGSGDHEEQRDGSAASNGTSDTDRQVDSTLELDLPGETQWNEANSITERVAQLLTFQVPEDSSVIVRGTDGDEKTFQIHKVILAMSSSVLAGMLYKESSQPLKIPDTSPRVFRNLLLYIYKEELKFDSMADTWDLWKLAQRFKMKHLADKTREHITTNISAENVLESLEKAVFYNDDELEAKCLEMIEKHAENVLQDEEFPALPKDVALKIIATSQLEAKEVTIFSAAYKWAKRNAPREDSIQEVFSPFQPHLEYDAMTASELSNVVMPTRLVSHEELTTHLLRMIAKMQIAKETESETRRKVREVTCCRSLNMVKTNIEASHNFNFNFKVETPPFCSFTGIQVTDYCDSWDSYYGRHNSRVSLSCVVKDHGSWQRVLFTCADNQLDAPYKVMFDTPIRVKAGSEYCIEVTLTRIYGDRTTISTFPQCIEKVSFNGLEVEFSNMSSSQQLVPNLYFVR